MLDMGRASLYRAFDKLEEDGLIDLAFVTSPFDLDRDLSESELCSFNEIAVCGESFRNISNDTFL